MDAKTVPEQMVMYMDDGVHVTYTDGSQLYLSPCGSVFLHVDSPRQNSHPLLGQKQLQQRTQFVTSAFKEKVCQALDFRNRFAERPYLCKETWTEGDIIKLHIDRKEAAWPISKEAANITVRSNGAALLLSLDECAVVTVSAHKQCFSVEYLARFGTSQSKGRSPVSKAASHIKTESSPPKAMDNSLNELLSENLRDSEILSPKKNAQTDKLFDTSGMTVSELNASHIVASSPLSQRSKSRTDGGPQQGGSHSAGNSALEKGSLPADTHITASQSYGDGMWDSVWVSQNFSILSFPDVWKYPVDLILSWMNTCSNSASSPSSPKPEDKGAEEDPESPGAIIKGQHLSPTWIAANAHTTSLPETLPLKCTNYHLHKWKLSHNTAQIEDTATGPTFDLTKKIKIVVVEGIIYRLVWSTPHAVEILPGDGSLIRSTSLSGHFYQHFLTKDGQVEERTYTILSPPPTMPGSAYSVAKLIGRAARYLEWLCHEEMQLTGSCSERPCWKQGPDTVPVVEPADTFLLEECVVPNQGKFLAYSNGRVRVVFSDRTCLDMWADFSDRVHMSDQSIQSKRMIPPDLTQGIAKLLLPNGTYEVVNVEDPGYFSRYVLAAKEWVEWVNCPAKERYDFYRDTIHDCAKRELIESELKKINCFSYLLEAKYTPSVSSWATHNEISNPAFSKLHDVSSAMKKTQPGENSDLATDSFNLSMVQEVLRKTSQAVADIDQFLSASKH